MHLKTKHLQQSSRENKCSKFCRVYSSRNNLRRHWKQCFKSDNKVEEKQFICHDCAHKTYSKYKLRQHIMAVHLGGINKIECKFCLRSFSDKYKQRKHEKYCSAPRVFSRWPKLACSHCSDYKTRSKDHLLTHLLKHGLGDADTNRCL